MLKIRSANIIMAIIKIEKSRRAGAKKHTIEKSKGVNIIRYPAI